MSDKNLEEQLFDIGMDHNNSKKWIHHKMLEKEKYFGGAESVEFEPEDAKTLEEVKSFRIYFDMTATEITTFERKK